MTTIQQETQQRVSYNPRNFSTIYNNGGQKCWDLSSKQFQQFSRKQYERAKLKDPIDLMLHMHLPVNQSFKTA